MMFRFGSRVTISPVFAAALCFPCPRCNVAAGFECVTKKTRVLVWPPHESRVKKIAGRKLTEEAGRLYAQAQR